MKSTAPFFYNITKSISDKTIVYPGDPPFHREEISSCVRGDACTLCHISMSNHLGTHIDFPSHFIPGGKTSSDFVLSDFIGTAIVIELPTELSVISEKDIPDDLVEGDFAFFKTRNSDLLGYSEDYVALDESAAIALLSKKIKMVGIDYLSIDRASDSSFSVHKTLLQADILIVENLALKDVPAGRYHARIYPLQIESIDGAPVTASLETVLNV